MSGKVCASMPRGSRRRGNQISQPPHCTDNGYASSVATARQTSNRTIFTTALPLTRSVEALQQVRPMRGGAQSQLMRCSDGRHYVVKFPNNPQGKEVLVNEWLGASIGRLMLLPVPDFAIVHVSQGLIRNTSDLRIQLRRGSVPCEAGQCFGSQHIGDVNPGVFPLQRPVWDLIPDSDLGTVENRDAFAGMLVFDQWTCNLDGRQAIYMRGSDDHDFRTYMIDNGLCFGAAEWKLDDAPLRGVYARICAYDSVRSFESFEPWLHRVESGIDLYSLETMASVIPIEWAKEDRHRLDLLLDALDRRRRRVRDLVWQTIKAAPAAFRNFEVAPHTTALAGSQRLIASKPGPRQHNLEPPDKRHRALA
jgi:HipA-like kinase